MRCFASQDLVLSGVWLLLALSVLNLVTTVHRLGIVGSLKDREYSYLGDDYPDHLPMPPTEPVSMFVEDSALYPLTGPTAETQWASVYPGGFGFVRLGAPRRLLCVSMFHQMHCVEKLRRALADPDDPVATIPHLQHCMNYIRQMVLCAADLTLEPEEYDPVRNVTEATGVGVRHTCRNWGTVYETIEENWADWEEYYKKYESTTATT